ncbi:MAG TPA: hypothetical protein VGJ73_11680 [Verrucomicrobiae bacterium]
MTFKPLRNLAVKPVRINNKKADKTATRPVANIGRAVWRGLKFHLRPRENFREILERLATTPFRINLPGFKAGKA